MSIAVEEREDSFQDIDFRGALEKVAEVRDWLSHVPPVEERSKLRREVGYSIERLSALIGCHHMTLSKFERGETMLRGEALEKYALFCATARGRR